MARQAGQGWGKELRAGTAPEDLAPPPPVAPPPSAGASPEPCGRLGRVQEGEGGYGAVKAVGSTRRRGLEDEDDPSRKKVHLTPADVSARSLRASGAMAMLCDGLDTDHIKLFGRWRSDELLTYLHVQAEPIY
ncbi:hypothetical protein THAOC_23722 [Thalassiosira oceanica]|uniref:Uncharacterized protein n=1 Tax=Thalassiosira oceanica TaxID=159749 RepID=K0RVB5_THAOC|nr:hypothetical protein THAOC_23722 [Thalassiosira oceanica]|eukprot:EJK56394.1 hypothetical protein THAOC_23722 [Thalassiosira oceanica]